MKPKNFDEQNNQSNAAFRKFAKHIENILGGGTLIISADVKDPTHIELDMKAGIDGYYWDNNGVKSLALRTINDKVNGNDSKFLNHLTFRYKGFDDNVEWDKKIYAFEHSKEGYILPSLTIQIFVDNLEHPTEITSGVIIPTNDLFNHICSDDYYNNSEKLGKMKHHYEQSAIPLKDKKYAIRIPFKNVQQFITEIPAFNGESNEKK